MKQTACYRIMAIMPLSKDRFYPMPYGEIWFTISGAIEKAKELANKVMKSHNDYTSMAFVGDDNEADSDNYTYHIKIIYDMNIISSIYVYPIEVENGDTSVHYYRGVQIFNHDNFYTVSFSGFKVNTCFTFYEALMFIDSTLYALELQQKDKEVN